MEVDAIEPRFLRQLVSESIRAHIDRALLARTRMLEERERASFQRLVDGFQRER